MEQAKGFHHQLLVVQQQVRVFPGIQVENSALGFPGRHLVSLQRKIFKFFCRALVPRRDKLVDNVGERELGVGELHGPPDEVSQSDRAVNIEGWLVRVGAALEAEGTQQAGKPKKVVAVEMSYENLGYSA